MKLNLKTYKIKKAKHCLKNEKIYFIFNQTNVSSEKERQLNNSRFSFGFKTYAFSNKLMKNALKNSIYGSLGILLNGPTVLTVLRPIFYDHKHSFSFLKYIELGNMTCFSGLKLNNKFYSPLQLAKLNTLEYTKNVKVLRGSFKKILMLPYSNLRKISK